MTSLICLKEWLRSSYWRTEWRTWTNCLLERIIPGIKRVSVTFYQERTENVAVFHRKWHSQSGRNGTCVTRSPWQQPYCYSRGSVSCLCVVRWQVSHIRTENCHGNCYGTFYYFTLKIQFSYFCELSRNMQNCWNLYHKSLSLRTFKSHWPSRRISTGGSNTSPKSQFQRY